MERHELNRIFERLLPAPEQEEAVWNRLLQREERPARRIGRWSAFPAAAVLLLVLVTCAAASVTGMDRRLTDFFGGGEETETLLLPGAMALDLTAESNGAELHVTQVLRDRYTVALAADFTAPAGAVLDTSNPKLTFGGFLPGEGGTVFFGEDGRSVGADYSYGWEWICLEDENPRDNRLSLLYFLHVTSGLREDSLPASFRLSVGDLEFFRWSAAGVETLCTGDWSMEVPLPPDSLGERQTFDRVAGELDGSDIRLREVYLSPVTMTVTLERDRDFLPEPGSEAWSHAFARWNFALDGEHFAAENGYEPAVERAVLTDRNGRKIPLEHLGSAGDSEADPEDGPRRNRYVFRLTEAAALEQLRGGTLTLRIGDGSCESPLDNLRPAAE